MLRPQRVVPPACLSRLFVLATFLPLANGRIEKGVLRFFHTEGSSEGSWHYIGKFGYSIGKGNYYLSVKAEEMTEEPLRLDLDIFLDEDWEVVKDLPPCSRHLAVPSSRTRRLDREGPGLWFRHGIMNNQVRSHIWYFALSTCGSQRLINETIEVKYVMHFTQSDLSELSVELKYMPLATLIVFCILSGFLVHFAMRCHASRANGPWHAIIWFLGVFVMLQWLAQVFYLWHLAFFEGAGYGDSLPKTLAGVAAVMGQLAISMPLIVISSGFTLVEIKSEALSHIGRVATFLALIHVLAAWCGACQADHIDKHHEFHGFRGKLLLCTRLAIWIWFVSGTRALRRSGGIRLEFFLQQFEIVGSMFLLSHVVIYAVVQVFAHYLQYPLMEIGLAGVQTLAALWLSRLFFCRSQYYEVSTLRSSLLPASMSAARCVPYESWCSSPSSSKSCSPSATTAPPLQPAGATSSCRTSLHKLSLSFLRPSSRSSPGRQSAGRCDVFS